MARKNSAKTQKEPETPETRRRRRRKRETLCTRAYWYFPRAVMGHTAATLPPLTTNNSSC